MNLINVGDYLLRGRISEKTYFVELFGNLHLLILRKNLSLHLIFQDENIKNNICSNEEYILYGDVLFDSENNTYFFKVFSIKSVDEVAFNHENLNQYA